VTRSKEICPCGSKQNPEHPAHCLSGHNWGDGFTNLKHGHNRVGHRTPEFTAWNNMFSRCLPTHNQAHLYYEKGITIHPSWKDFVTFLRDIGYRPSSKHTLDRIDSNKNYEPGNVRWATMKEQQRNKSNNFRITLAEKTLTLIEWSEISGVPAQTIRKRLMEYKGWTTEEAIFLPPHKGHFNPRKEIE